MTREQDTSAAQDAVGPENCETWLAFSYGPGLDPEDHRDVLPGFHVRHKTERGLFMQCAGVVTTVTLEEAQGVLAEWGDQWEIVLAKAWTSSRFALPGYMDRHRKRVIADLKARGVDTSWCGDE